MINKLIKIIIKIHILYFNIKLLSKTKSIIAYFLLN